MVSQIPLSPLIHDSLHHVIITLEGRYCYLSLRDKAQSSAVNCLESQFLLEKHRVGFKPESDSKACHLSIVLCCFPVETFIQYFLETLC